jgi:hypothetical protein
VTATAGDRPDDDRYITRRETQAILEADQARFLSRREADQWRASMQQLIDTLVTSHQEQHSAEAQAVTLQLKHHEATRDEHEQAHFRDHLAHEKIHSSEQDSIAKALNATQVLAAAHDKAHEREHEAHTREHALDKLAIDKAERANDLRYAGEAGTLEAMRKEYDRRIAEAIEAAERRYTENRLRIESLEKGDVKGEGKALGMSNVAALIVGGAGLVATILGIVIIIANFATRNGVPQ